jgi:Crinkler effector protein N-terminal domain
MPRTLELNCLVLGDDPGLIFTVKISEGEYVCALKKEIWKENRNKFKDVRPDALILWKVSLPVNRKLKQKLDAFEPDEETKLRKPITRLSSVFRNPKDGHLHIIVQHPCECPYLVPSPQR